MGDGDPDKQELSNADTFTEKMNEEQHYFSKSRPESKDEPSASNSTSVKINHETLKMVKQSASTTNIAPTPVLAELAIGDCLINYEDLLDSRKVLPMKVSTTTFGINNGQF